MDNDLISRQRLIDFLAEIYAVKGFDWKEVHFSMNDMEMNIIMQPSAQPERKKLPPIYKRGTDVVHVSYADGHGGFEYRKWADWVCPVCGWFVGEQYVPRHHNQNRANFCSRCGCEIDWENAKEDSDD